jgi:hypothetical protein
LTISRGMLVVAGKKMGSRAGETYAALGKDVSPANQAFVEEHFNKLRTLFAKNRRSRK